MRLVLCASFPVLCALLASCAALRAPLTPPNEGGPAWIEVTSTHFVLRTDLLPDDAVKRARELEDVDAALVALAFKSDNPPTDKIEVIVFQTKADFEAVAWRGWLGGFTAISEDNYDGDHVRIVLPASFSDRERRVVQHELTHRYIHYFMPGAPVWLNEGMACFYETMHTERGVAVIGESKFPFTRGGNDSHQRIPIDNLPSATTIAAMPAHVFYAQDDKRAGLNYAAAWLLVSMLVTGPEANREHFWRYVHDLTQGVPADEAWHAELAKLPLDEQFADYRHTGKSGIARVPYQSAVTPEDAFAVRAMRDAEVRVLFASLAPSTPGAAKLLRAATAEEPRSPETHYWAGLHALLRGEPGFGAGELEEAASLAPAQSKYLVALANAHYLTEVAKPKSEQHLETLAPEMEKLAALNNSATAQNTVAWFYSDVGDADRGLPFAKRALELAPGCWACVDTMAKLVSMKGDAAQALVLERRAVAEFPGEVPPKEMLDAIHKYESEATKQER